MTVNDRYCCVCHVIANHISLSLLMLLQRRTFTRSWAIHLLAGITLTVAIPNTSSGLVSGIRSGQPIAMLQDLFWFWPRCTGNLSGVMIELTLLIHQLFGSDTDFWAHEGWWAECFCYFLSENRVVSPKACKPGTKWAVAADKLWIPVRGFSKALSLVVAFLTRQGSIIGDMVSDSYICF